MEEIPVYEEIIRLKRTGGAGVLVTVIASSGPKPSDSAPSFWSRRRWKLRAQWRNCAVDLRLWAVGQPRWLSLL